MIKKTNSYKGFETWFNGIRMALKMHLYVFLAFFVIHIITALTVTYFLQGKRYAVLGRYLLDSVKAGHMPDTYILRSYFDYLSVNFIYVLTFTAVVYCGCPFVIAMFKRKSKRQLETKHLRGARLVSAQEFARQIGPGDLPFGSFRLPKQEEIKHCLTVGRPGAGKTVFLSQVTERLIEREAKAVVYDFNGGYVERFYDPRRDIIFNPLDRRSVEWNLFSDIKTKRDINVAATSLIPPVYTGDTFRNDAAREVFSGILHYLWRNNFKTNSDIWKGVAAPAKKIHEWLRITPEGQAGYRYIEDAGSRQTLSSVFAAMTQYAHAFQYMSHGDSAFSVTDWLSNDRPGFIFVTNQSDDTLKPILSLFVDFLGKKLLSLPDDLKRRVFFLLDEFGTLQRLSSIQELLIASGSKGGSCWIGIQDIRQLNNLYTPDAADTIVNACCSSVIFAVSDPKTAKYLVDKIGDEEIIETEETFNMGVSNYRDGVSLTQREKRQRLILDSELMNLPDLHAYVKIPNNPSITLSKFEIRDYPAKEPSFIIKDEYILEEVVQKQEELIKQPVLP
ncbi:MAG: type IV secretion system DNA-binding domain-containing protein [Syntrophobacterales bacterium]|jgi:type IV secretory pathway TraG/TraD family ATPase VirD4|nr:type IV secretion system DNA-binding domain-containing protein [Syntrophobacterales bacterium]